MQFPFTNLMGLWKLSIQLKTKLPQNFKFTMAGVAVEYESHLACEWTLGSIWHPGEMEEHGVSQLASTTVKDWLAIQGPWVFKYFCV